MADAIIDPLKELVDRINGEITSGGKLENVTFFQGYRRKVTTHQEAKSIIMNFMGGIENYDGGGYKQKVADWEVSFMLTDKIDNQDANNLIFDSDNETGFLYFIQDFLDTIHTKTDRSTLDAKLNDEAREPMKITLNPVEFDQGEMMMQIDVTFKIQPFTINTRRSA